MFPCCHCVQVTSHSRSSSLDGNCPTYSNTAALFTSLQHGHLQSGTASERRPSSVHSAPSRNHEVPPHANASYTTNAGLSASLYNSLNTLLSQAHGKQPYARPLNDCSFSSGVSTQTQRNNSKTACVDPPLCAESDVEVKS